jgi:HK97 family phage prohead protease
MKPLKVSNEFLIEKVTEATADKPFRVGGYIKKFGKQNENGEVILPTAWDDFIENYFVKNGLNVTCDLMHGGRFDDLIGKVVLMEKNTVGIWIEVELSATAPRYSEAVAMIKSGILQGFSDYGWATDYDVKYKSDGEFSHCEIKQMKLIRVSIVDAPSEVGAKLEVQNATEFKNFEAKKNKFLNL